MDDIKWCLKQNKGIELVEPNENLGNAYLLKAEEALDTLNSVKSKSWQLIAAYYTIYNGIYSILMKIGIKCEIHKCTIKFSKKYLKDYFVDSDFELIDMAFDARIDSQYYIERRVSEKNYNNIVTQTPMFLVKCKNIMIKHKEIIKIRNEILRLLK
jgi:uncharacterized protein (UPF0332 family)